MNPTHIVRIYTDGREVSDIWFDREPTAREAEESMRRTASFVPHRGSEVWKYKIVKVGA